MALSPQQIDEIHAELGGLAKEDIKKRLAAGLWSPEKRRVTELYLENKELARRNRFSEADRNIQRWILAVAIGALVATILTWFLN